MFRKTFRHSEKHSEAPTLVVGAFFMSYFCIVNERKREMTAVFEAAPRKPLALGKARKQAFAFRSLMRSLKC